VHSAYTLSKLRKLRLEALSELIIIAIVWSVGATIYPSPQYVAGYLISSLVMLGYTAARVRAELMSGAKPPVDYVKPSVWRFGVQLILMERFLWLAIGMLAFGGAAAYIVTGSMELSMGFLVGVPFGFLMASAIYSFIGYFRGVAFPTREEALRQYLQKYVRDGVCVLCGEQVVDVLKHFAEKHREVYEAALREVE
jgi:hypothetical protein